MSDFTDQIEREADARALAWIEKYGADSRFAGDRPRQIMAALEAEYRVRNGGEPPKPESEI